MGDCLSHGEVLFQSPDSRASDRVGAFDIHPVYFLSSWLEVQLVVLVPIDVVSANLVGFVIVRPAKQVFDFVCQTFVVAGPLYCCSVVIDLPDPSDPLSVGCDYTTLSVVIIEWSIHAIASTHRGVLNPVGNYRIE
jgi:hypothetical protein